MLDALTLPDGLAHVRTTETFTASTTPHGLRRAHRLTPGVWGRLRVEGGTVLFVVEETGESRRLGIGDTQVIEPEVAHHVEPGEGASFTVEFHR